MNDDRSLERAARSWLETGPSQAPDRAVDAALLLIKTTSQERDLRVPWRFFTMTTTARVATAAVIGVLVIGGTLFILAKPGQPAVGGPTTSPSPAPIPSAAEIPPSTAKVYTRKGTPGFSIDLTSGWFAVDEGASVRLSYLGPDGSTAAGQVVIVDQTTVIVPDGEATAPPQDLVGWIQHHPWFMASTPRGTSIAGFPATRIDIVGSPAVSPEARGLLPGAHSAFMGVGGSSARSPLEIIFGERWTFIVVDAPQGRLLVVMTEQDEAAQKIIEDAVGTLRFTS